MTYKKIYMTFNIKRHMHARVIFRWLFGCFVLWLLFWGRHSHTQIYKQMMNKTKHTWTMTDFCGIVMNVMFDVEILLFILTCGLPQEDILIHRTFFLRVCKESCFFCNCPHEHIFLAKKIPTFVPQLLGAWGGSWLVSRSNVFKF